MTVAIEMVSDLVCPWCWLGLRRIRKAMEIAEDVDVQLVFRPYELDPMIPVEGVEYKAYHDKKFGASEATRERARMMRNALIQYGDEEGVPFNFDGIAIRPNSLNAHRLVRWAQGQDKAMDAKEALFSAFFEHGRDIGDAGVLSEIAENIGLDKTIVADLLVSDADIQSVREEEAVFQQMGVTGVPTYIANRQLAAQGAETPEKLAWFLRAAANHQPQERGRTGNA